MNKGYAIAVIVMVGLVSAACGNTAETTSTSAPAATTTSQVQAATTTTAAPTTTLTSVATSTTAAGGGFVKESDVVYMTVDGFDYLMDVYTPDSEGPWPVAVVFHGIDSDEKNGLDQTVIAEGAAASGFLVFVPSWLGEFSGLDLETWYTWKEVTGCAVAFAQEQAAERGADPANTVLYGFSAGVGGPLWATLDPIAGPISGCLTDATSVLPTGVVLGDGNVLLFSEEWDRVFDSDPEAMQTELAAFYDPTRWPADLSARVFIWVATSGSPPSRPIASRWMEQRDPDGSLLADLETLGLLDDGRVSTGDAGRLLAMHMEEGGLEVTVDEYPGGHRVIDKVDELVGYIVAAAA